MSDATHPKILLLVRFKSTLSRDELVKRHTARMPEFQALPGLLQKYYAHDAASDEWCGFYLWDSQESLDEYLASDLRTSIPEAYGITGAPRIEVLTVFDTLRPERT